MFEFFLALKYLLPKRKQLSLALISMMATAVISVVIWLLLVFLSVTDGLEKNWLSKLTDLNAPLRINPSPKYFSSYYYVVDNYAEESNFRTKSLGEKLQAVKSDPFNPSLDMYPATFLPVPDRKSDGSLKDPVKGCFNLLNSLRRQFPGLYFQEYEISGASLRLEIIKKGDVNEPASHTYLNQVAYVTNLADKSPYQGGLILTPNREDIQNLLEQSLRVEKKDPLFSQENLLKEIQLKRVSTKASSWHLDPSFLKEGFHATAIACQNSFEAMEQIILPKTISSSKESLPSPYKLGTLIKTTEGLFFKTPNALEKVPDGVVLTLDYPLSCEVVAQDEKKPLPLEIQAEIQNNPIQGFIDLEHLNVEAFEIVNRESNWIPWVHWDSKKESYVIPQSANSYGIIVPKNFYDSGTRIGHRGHLSYGAMTASSLQEQKLSVFVAGFYDPGIIAVGGKCILASKELAHILATDSSSYAVEKGLSNGILVWLKDISKTAQLKTAIVDALKQAGISSYFFVTPFTDYEYTKDILQQFQSDKILFSVVGVIILAVACCNIISLLNLLIYDKKKEIAILQTLGASPKSLIAIFSLCSLTLGIVSSLLGIALSYVTLHYLEQIVTFLTWVQGYNPFNEIFYGSSLPNTLSLSAVVKVLLYTPLLSLIAGIAPAIKALRIAPSTALKAD